MTALSRLSALRLEERELLALKCADRRCKHPLGAHSLATDRCAGELGLKPCPCKGWRDPTQQMALS